jgi:hypothetical protein
MNIQPQTSRRFLVVGCLLLFLPAPGAHADLSLRLTLDKPTYLLFEPLLVRVTVVNYTGRTVAVGMTPQATHRLDFSIARPDGTAVGRSAAGRAPAPVQIPHGREADIVVDLIRLYRLRSEGMYRVSATIAGADSDNSYRTPTTLIEVVKGRSLWSRTIGMPGPEGEDAPPETRTYEILINRIGAYNHLYLRIRDEKKGLVYGVHPLGTYVPLNKPEVELDTEGVIHILHQLAPRSYAHSAFRPNGERVVRDFYSDLLGLPRLFLSPTGEVTVLGGEPVEPEAPGRRPPRVDAAPADDEPETE